MLQETKNKSIRDAYELVTRAILRIPFRLNIRYKRIISITTPTYVLIHGLADTGEMWKPIVKKLPKNTNYVVVDLLGHGDSRISSAKVYSADYQARNVIATCLSLGLVGDYKFIGHSFGSIVAIECARIIPNTKQLILCSLPLYNKPKKANVINPNEPETILFSIYNEVIRHPKSIMTAYNLSDTLRLFGASHTRINPATFPAFVETIKSGVINQQSRQHLLRLGIPITIIYGRFDPLVIGKNIDDVAKNKPNITVAPIINDHALRPPMIKAILDNIRNI
jgi:pimeloyl-ACP methyl ester carboxylesterase